MWFIKTEAGECGPYTPDELRERVRTGEVRPDTPVSGDRKHWTDAGKFAFLGFAEAFPPEATATAGAGWWRSLPSVKRIGLVTLPVPILLICAHSPALILPAAKWSAVLILLTALVLIAVERTIRNRGSRFHRERIGGTPGQRFANAVVLVLCGVFAIVLALNETENDKQAARALDRFFDRSEQQAKEEQRRRDDKVTLANYQRLEMGMPLSRVCEVLGHDYEEKASSKSGGSEVAIYCWRSSVDGGILTATFEDYRLTAKAQTGLR